MIRAMIALGLYEAKKFIEDAKDINNLARQMGLSIWDIQTIIEKRYEILAESHRIQEMKRNGELL